MRRARTTVLVTAVAMCLAVLVTPVASAGKPTPFAFTGGTITETAIATTATTTTCVWSGTINYTGKVPHHGLSWALQFADSLAGMTVDTGTITPSGSGSGSFTISARIPAHDFGIAGVQTTDPYMFATFATIHNNDVVSLSTPSKDDTDTQGTCPSVDTQLSFS